MAAVPAALAGYRQSLLHAAGARAGCRAAADRQVRGAVRHLCRPVRHGFFSGLAETVNPRRIAGPALTCGAAASARPRPTRPTPSSAIPAQATRPARPGEGCGRAGALRTGFTGFPRRRQSISRRPTPGVGPNSWQIEAELIEVAERIAPGAGPAGAAAVLDADPAHQVVGLDALQGWIQQTTDRAIAELGDTHFEIPEPIRTVECLIAPPGGGVGAYYTGPSDDLSRPGQVWWAVEPGREVFPTWRETSTVYHEGVPGHHLQIGTAVYRKDTLNDFQRLLAGISGHCEGWALYAEQLVRELGYHRQRRPVARPAGLPAVPGRPGDRRHRDAPGAGNPLRHRFSRRRTMDPGARLEFLLTRTITDPAHCRDEIDRYLGWPGQAPSYKIGERVWIAGRDAARRRHGDDVRLQGLPHRGAEHGRHGPGSAGAGGSRTALTRPAADQRGPVGGRRDVAQALAGGSVATRGPARRTAGDPR